MDVFDAVAKLELDSKDYVQGLNDAMETLKRFEETAAKVFDAVGQSAVNMQQTVGQELDRMQKKLDSLEAPEVETDDDGFSLWEKLKETLQNFKLPDLSGLDILGTASDAAGSLSDALGNVGNLMPNLSGMFGGLGGDVAGVAVSAAALLGSMEAMKLLHDSMKDSGGNGAEQPDLDSVLESAEKLNEQLDRFASAVGETVPGAVSNLAGTLAPVAELFGSGFPEAMSASSETAESFAASVETLGGALGLVFGSAAEDVGTVADAFTAMSGDVVGGLEAIRAEIPAVFEAVGSEGSAAAGELDASFTAVIDGIEAKWSALLSFVTSAYESISSMASAAQSMGQMISEARTNLQGLKLGNVFDLPAPDLSSTKLGARLEHSLDVVGDKLSQFGTTVVDKAQSVLGKFETSINSSVMLAGQSGPSPVNVKVNLDGREMAAALYDPLIEEGKRSGKSLYQK